MTQSRHDSTLCVGYAIVVLGPTASDSMVKRGDMNMNPCEKNSFDTSFKHTPV